MGAYNPHQENISYFLSHVSKALDKLLANNDNLLLIGDFNASVSEPNLKDFCEVYNLVNLIKVPTCFFKSATNPYSIHVMLTNRQGAFKNSRTMETGLSDHNKLIISVLTTYFKKKESVKINYRSYKNVDEYIFRNDLFRNLQNCDSNSLQYDEFKDIFMQVLNDHAPKKQKVVRGNTQPFMNKVLSKAFMNRSKLKNDHNKDPTDINKSMYKKQRNFCVNLLRKEKKKYYNNLDLKIFKDNRKF